ncbi:TraX family protein [Aureliella helgolandensis]|uniref:TraX protein n=1 Tax=Aureliella helgolandensis TaxID=2527968 RepID=A0A518GEM3_9BACT|nr:TraX family protein [Aureliella helgolandensis]QDV27051.1 TraX protein [Aureliella helgolandensis]
MPKKTKKTKKASAPETVPLRNRCLDTLRGLAITLMVVDHASDLFFNMNIEPSNVRMVTRLSMPLFCILMGYFLARSRRVHWERLLQIGAATVVTNVLFYTLYGKLEILASLLVCYVGIVGLKLFFVPLVLAPFLFSWDASQAVFDFPLSIVAGCVAQGVILRCGGLRVAIATGIVLTVAALVVSEPSRYVLWFVLPATLLIALGIARPQWHLRGLEWIGRFPLSIYVAQYYLLVLLSR